jgi:hypothetical protein
VQLYNRRWNAPPPVTRKALRELWTGEALVFVIVVIVAMPPAITIPIAMPINATPLQAAKDPAGDVFARIRFPSTASILVAYHSNLSNLIDAVVAPERIQRHGRCAGCNSDTTGGTCQDDDLVGHRDLQLLITMIAKRLLRRMVAASAVAYASRSSVHVAQSQFSFAHREEGLWDVGLHQIQSSGLLRSKIGHVRSATLAWICEKPSRCQKLPKFTQVFSTAQQT